jgi:hypothetical protein
MYDPAGFTWPVQRYGEPFSRLPPTAVQVVVFTSPTTLSATVPAGTVQLTGTTSTASPGVMRTGRADGAYPRAAGGWSKSDRHSESRSSDGSPR